LPRPRGAFRITRLRPWAAFVLAWYCLTEGGAVDLRAGYGGETGSFVIRTYSNKEYRGQPENWAIAEDSRGIVYVANGDGLLEFDGITWRKIPLPGAADARAVAVDSKGTVYFGGAGVFGYLKPDASGTEKVISLVNSVAPEDRNFGDVWRALPVREGVYFCSYRRIFRLNPNGSIHVWRTNKSFGRPVSINGAVYVKTPDRGLMKMDGDNLTPVPGGERLASSAMEGAVSYRGGGLIAMADRLYRLTPSGVDEFRTGADSYFAVATIYSIGILPGGEIAAGTQKGGLVLLNGQGEVDRILTARDHEIPDDFVSAIHTDRSGGVWLAHYTGGISRFNPGLTQFDERQGLQNAQYSLRHNGTLFAGTTSGLFRLQTEPQKLGGGQPRFERVDGIESMVWSLHPYGSDVLAATNGGVYLVSGGRAAPVWKSEQAVFDLSVAARDHDTAYVAGKGAVVMLQKQGGQWRKAKEFAAPGQEIRTVVEDNAGIVWAAASGAIWRLDFRQTPVEAQKLDSSQGVPDGKISALRYGDHVLFATRSGLRRYSEQMKRLAPDLSLGAEIAKRDVLNVFEDRARNAVWVTGSGYHGILSRQGGVQRWLPMPLLQSGIDEIYWLSLDEDGIAWATAADGDLFRWDQSLAGNPDRDFRVLMRTVQTSDEKHTLYGGWGVPPAIRLPYATNALRFDFAAPFYEDPGAVEYRVKLEGIDRDWLPWSHDTKAQYPSLPEHMYTFHVQARSPHGTTAEDASFRLGVLAPWYRTWWAYTLYAILAALGIWGIVRWRVRQLEEDKRQLEQTVAERTVEIRQQRDEIQAQERKSHALLLNILPSKVADELKSTGAVKPVGFDEVTVCFTDFVGFTLSSEKLPPDRLVDALNEYFTAFDEIIARYGLEKLKTIGDSYMFASGLPARRASHAVDAVLAAMEMAETVRRLATKPGGTGWNIRIGLHSGPVVAGVVGTRKFAFDIWGTTVNFAARMESSGVPGRVNLSERTWKLTHELIDCEARGHVKIKEGRELPMYLARGTVGDFTRRYKIEFDEEPKAMPNIASSDDRGRSLDALVR
jgi:class 3 adenylate cyclase